MWQAAKNAAARQPPRIRFPYQIARGVASIAAVEQPPTHLAQDYPPPVTTKSLERDEFWREVPTFQDVSKKDFLSYRWSVCWPHTAYPLSDT